MNSMKKIEKNYFVNFIIFITTVLTRKQNRNDKNV